MRLSTLLFTLAGCAMPFLAFSQAPSRPLTAPGSFTGEIEGPAVDADGNIYAVSFHHKTTIGKVTPEGQGEIFVEMPKGSTANGIRFFPTNGMMYVADYTGHQILEINPKTKKIAVFADEATMHQPNDIAISREGILYASDPDWANGTGQVWRIDRSGRVTKVASNMGTTNGIDISPDGKILYVNESVQRKIWAFDILPDGSLAGKRLLAEFPDFGFDGMRVDVDGNLYVTRHGKGTVAKVSPKGDVLEEYRTLGTKPSNLCFGGPDGRTIYVTEMERGRLVQFRVDRPGLEWQRWQDARSRK